MQSSSMSMTTGLVSLNVHDPLTFEGVEIVINPDLFSNMHNLSNRPMTGSSSGRHSRDSSFSSVHVPVPPSSSYLSYEDSSNAPHPLRSVGSGLGGDMNMNVGSASTCASPKIHPVLPSSIQAGDRIEIKVWDRKPHNPNQTQSPNVSASASTIHRQRTPQRGGMSLSSSTATVKTTVAGGANASTSRDLAKVASRLQQQISTSVFPPQQQQQQQDGITHPLSKRPPMGPRTTSVGGGTSHGASPSAKSGAGFGSGDDASRQSFILPQRSYSDVSDSSNAIIPPLDLASSTSPPGTVSASAPQHVSSTKDLNNNALNKNNHGHGPGGLSVIKPLSAQDQVPGSSSATGDIPNDLRPSHSRISSSGSALTTNSNLTAEDSLLSSTMTAVPESTFVSALDLGSGSIHTPDRKPPDMQEEFEQQPQPQPHDPLEEISQTHIMRKSFVAAVTEKSLTALKPGGRTQISILRNVAELYRLISYDLVTITRIGKNLEEDVVSDCQADFMTVSVKDQFVSRGDMYRFQSSVVGKWIYEGERLSLGDGIRGTIMDIRHGNERFKSAFITEDSKITFRSMSARIIWLVQISSEMWDYASTYETSGGGDGACEIYFDRFVSFMYRLFEEWKALEVTHSLTVVFFSRTLILPNGSTLNPNAANSPAIQRDEDGKIYEDHYKVVVENESPSDWETLITIIKRNFIRYPLEVGWKLTSDYVRLPSIAAQGNILEAINTALNMLQLHYIDRDLHRVGNSIVVVSAGSGVFEVHKTLAAITKQRMMDNGIGSDMLSLGLPPLHVVPFMRFKKIEAHRFDGQEITDPNIMAPHEDVDDFDGWKANYEIPHWIHLSYFNYDQIGSQQVPSSKPITITENLQVQESRSEYSVSNGFLVRQSNSEEKSGCESIKVGKMKDGISESQHRQRHLVLERSVEDILEACRPRNRGDGGAPPPLLSQLKLFGLLGEKNRNNISNISEGDEIIDKVLEAPREWNTVNPDDPILNPRQGFMSANQEDDFALRKERGFRTNESLASSDFSGHSSPSLSAFYNLSTSMKNMQIQLSSSLDIPLHITDIGRDKVPKSRSHGSLPEEDSDDMHSHKDGRSNSFISSDSISISNRLGKLSSLEAMRKFMDHHDKNISYNAPDKSRDAENLHAAETMPLGIGDTDIQPMSYTAQDANGIGAAIRAHGGKGNAEKVMATPSKPRRLTHSTTASTLKKSMAATSSNNFHEGHSTFSRPSSLALSFDEKVAMGLNISNHNSTNQLISSMFLPGVNQITSSDKIQQRPIKMQLDSDHHKNTAFKPVFAPRKEITVPTLKSNKNSSNSNDRKTRNRKKPRQTNRKPGKAVPHSSHHTRRKQWVLNPFRQEDEEIMLSQRTHNSRRWSHVFPKGEIEFKRQSGPNWKSLCQPAILPLTIDVYPTPQELKDETKYSINDYNIDLKAIGTHYTSSDLLMEMVRQRIVQDFQIVPHSVLAKSRRGVGDSNESKRLQHSKKYMATTTPAEIQHSLSMGHVIHTLTFNPTKDSVEVNQYFAKNANNQKVKPFDYKYNLWMPLTGRYQHVSQVFQRFPAEYPWNRLDNSIAGDHDILDTRTKYRRIAFCIIPDKFYDMKSEQLFIQKAQKFLEYLDRLVGKQNLDVQIVSTNSHTKEDVKSKKKTSDSLTHFIIKSRKRERYEWFELAVGKSFDTRKTYRIILKWLVASASNIESHITMLQRRCTQYKLNLVIVSEMSSCSNLSLNPLKRPENITVSDSGIARAIELSLLEKFGFRDDGQYSVLTEDVERAFAVKMSMNQRSITAQQYLHLSGTLFVRILRDINQSVTFVFLENTPFIGNNVQLKDLVSTIFRDVHTFISHASKPLDLLS